MTIWYVNFYKRSGNRVAKLFCSTLCGSRAFNRLLHFLGAWSPPLLRLVSLVAVSIATVRAPTTYLGSPTHYGDQTLVRRPFASLATPRRPSRSANINYIKKIITGSENCDYSLTTTFSISGTSCSDFNKSKNSFDRHRPAEKKNEVERSFGNICHTLLTLLFQMKAGKLNLVNSATCSSSMLLSGEITRTLALGFVGIFAKQN